MQFYPTLAHFADNYDGFILDLWGVVHDGSVLYPGVQECLINLRERGKKIVFLSNAPRRASRVEATLNQLGIAPNLYDYVLSSGEAAFSFLAQPDISHSQQPYYYMGPEKDAGLLDGLPYTRVKHLKQAKFLLNVDVEYHGQEVKELDPILLEARAHSLPMVCVNPDIEVVKQSGQHIWCAGAIARVYEVMGGEVSYFGKPYTAVYDAALTLLGGLERKHVLAVGDNIDTDILGGNLHEIDSALVTGGILSREMPNPDPYALRELCESKQAIPTYVVPAFRW